MFVIDEMLDLVRGQEHGQWAEFAFHGIEHHAEGFERDRAEQDAVLLFAENDRGGALAAIEPEQHVADLARDFGAIRQGKGALRVRTDAEFAEQGGRNNGVHSSRIDQESELDRTLRSCRVSDIYFDVSQAHQEPRDSSVVCAEKYVKVKGLNLSAKKRTPV